MVKMEFFTSENWPKSNQGKFGSLKFANCKNWAMKLYKTAILMKMSHLETSRKFSKDHAKDHFWHFSTAAIFPALFSKNRPTVSDTFTARGIPLFQKRTLLNQTSLLNRNAPLHFWPIRVQNSWPDVAQNTTKMMKVRTTKNWAWLILWVVELL